MPMKDYPIPHARPGVVLQLRLVDHTCACGTVTPQASPKRKRCDACGAELKAKKLKEYKQKAKNTV